jgi:hypothetical protein
MNYKFSFPLELEGLHLADVEASVDLDTDGDPDRWFVEGIKSITNNPDGSIAEIIEGQIEISKHAIHGLPAILSFAMQNAWNRIKKTHDLQIRQMLEEADQYAREIDPFHEYA